MSFRLATGTGGKRETLFDALEHFANLTDDLEQFRRFKQEYPDFLPVDEDARKAEPEKAHHEAVLSFVTSLQCLWRGVGGPGVPRVCAEHLHKLLDLVPVGERHLGFPGQLEPRLLDDQEQSYRQAAAADPTKAADLEKFLEWKSLPRTGGPWATHPVTGTTFIADWWSGGFLLYTARNFHVAVVLLWRERWRAKVCARCARYFIATKPARLYCSTKCFGEAKQERDREWWTERGSARRKKRSHKVNKSQRKRGK